MRTHRAFAPVLGASMQLSSDESEHLRVLRARLGDAVTLFNGAGLEADGIITALEPAIRLRVDPPRAVNLEPPQPVTLAVALLKADKLSEVVRAVSELGVSRVQLLVTERSDARDIGTQKLERLRRIALEAAKQCGRNVVPEVLQPIALRDLVPVECGLVAQPHSSRLPREAANWQHPITIVTGPEGGFSSAELDLLVARGFQAVTLGKRILRAETAPIALLGAVIAGEGL